MCRHARLPVMVGMFSSNINALSGDGRGIAYGLPGASPIGPPWCRVRPDPLETVTPSGG